MRRLIAHKYRKIVISDFFNTIYSSSTLISLKNNNQSLSRLANNFILYIQIKYIDI